MEQLAMSLVDRKLVYVELDQIRQFDQAFKWHSDYQCVTIKANLQKRLFVNTHLRHCTFPLQRYVSPGGWS